MGGMGATAVIAMGPARGCIMMPEVGEGEELVDALPRLSGGRTTPVMGTTGDTRVGDMISGPSRAGGGAPVPLRREVDKDTGGGTRGGEEMRCACS